MNYPMHEKLKALKGKNQGLGYVLENGLLYAGDKKLEFILAILGHRTCENGPTDKELCDFINWFRAYKKNKKRAWGLRLQDVLAAYYGIDEQVLDKEKRVMLAELRKVSA